MQIHGLFCFLHIRLILTKKAENQLIPDLDLALSLNERMTNVA